MSVLTAEGTFTPQEGNFVFTNAGMGDYICWFSSIKYIAEQVPHLKGHIWIPNWMMDLASELIRPYPHWTVRAREKYEEEADDDVKSYFCLASHHALGFHMVDYGFHLFANINPPPADYNYYVNLKPEVDLKPHNLPAEYVVLTPCATTPIRTQSPESWNGFKSYLIKQGLTPVLVGQTIFGGRCQPPNSGYDFEGCLSLLNCLSLREAQVVMSQAQAVVGLDNGLLHLAATSEVPIVFGQNIASPEHRAPRRRRGKHVHLVPGLPCDFCQSNIRFTEHFFTHCIYKHARCLEALNTQAWIGAFETLMGDTHGNRSQTSHQSEARFYAACSPP